MALLVTIHGMAGLLQLAWRQGVCTRRTYLLTTIDNRLVARITHPMPDEVERIVRQARDRLKQR